MSPDLPTLPTIPPAAFVDDLAGLRVARGVDLVVIDPLASFMAGGSENEAGCMLETLSPLQRLTSQGQSVLVLHHPRRRPAAPGQAARGSGALSGFADILIEMRALRGLSREDRRRRLVAFARYPETPGDLVIALNPEGTDYLTLGGLKEAEYADGIPTLAAILERVSRPLNRAEIRHRWPAPRPDAECLTTWLEQSASTGLLKKCGEGVKKDPFRYWLPASEDEWRKDPLAVLGMPEVFGPYHAASS